MEQSTTLHNIDILEESIADIDPSILKILLKDKTTRKNILWCTSDYRQNGSNFKETDEIKINQIVGPFRLTIQPRAAKAKEIQNMRIKTKAEVFTPSWVCNEQNNLVDEAWFGRKDVFNIQGDKSWTPTTNKIEFPKNKTWKKYVDIDRLEITCGEAPYLVSRYDTTTGDWLEIEERIGLFDRKMRILNENAENDEEWLKWSIRAIQSVYGYEYQGDSLLIARENLFFDYIDYYKAWFNKEPDIELLQKIANIIAWNLWQMDGLKYVVPFSCHSTKEQNIQPSLFEEFDNQEEVQPCPGCKNNDIFSHNGIYCKIYDWTNEVQSHAFIDLLRGGK